MVLGHTRRNDFFQETIHPPLRRSVSQRGTNCFCGACSPAGMPRVRREGLLHTTHAIRR